MHDGFQPQTNLVRRDGRHSALLPILSSGSASTLAVVSDLKKLLPTVQAGLPKALKIDYLFDQSVFVRASITGVLREAGIAAGLTAVMILLFLRSWRSTVIVITSIPLSILVSIICLKALHETLNVMTLGGMALAVGILVDDATVEIENNHRHMEMGKPLRIAILDGAGSGHAGFRRHVVDLHRLRADFFRRRRGRLPLCPAGDGRDLCHARELSAFANVGPHDGSLSACTRSKTARQSEND